jgi:hypothetical protein
MAVCGTGWGGEDMGRAVTVVTVEGETSRLVLTGLTAAELTLDKGALPLKNVAAVEFAARNTDAPSGVAIHLRNGDVLQSMAVTSGDETTLMARGDAWGELRIESKYLLGLVFNNKQGPPADAVADFLKGAPPKEDQLLTAKGQTVPGYVERIGAKELSFNAGGQSRVYPFDELAAFRMAPLEEYKPRTEFIGKIELRDGSRVTGRLLGLTNGKLSFEALNGKTWTAAADALASITFQGGKLVYLSDLKPATVEEKPYVGGMPVVFRWRRDRSTAGGPIMLDGKQHDKGLGVHSYTKLVYDLDGQYAKFLCEVGMDSAAASAGACAWQVLVEGKVAAEGVAKAGDRPQSVKADVSGAHKLALVCDYGPDDSDAGDHLDWAGARLLKP